MTQLKAYKLFEIIISTIEMHYTNIRNLCKQYNFIMFKPVWVKGTLGNILTSIVSNSYFGERPVVGDMTVFGSHVGLHVSENACSYSWFVHSLAAKPSQGLIFDHLVMPFGWDIQKSIQYGSVAISHYGGWRVHEGIWKYMKLYKRIWRHIKVRAGDQGR